MTRKFTSSCSGEQKKQGRPHEKSLEAKEHGLYIYGLPVGVTVRELIEVFSVYGPIINVGIVGKPKRQERAYAFIDFETTESASRAVAGLKSKNLFGMSEPLELRLRETPKAATKPSLKEPRLDSKEAKETPKDLSKGPKPAASAQSQSDVVFDFKTLHIGNLPLTVEKADLEKAFSVHGEIRRLQLVQRPKEKRALAFISFKTVEHAAAAIKATKGKTLFGMTESLKLDFSKQEKKKSTDAGAAAKVDKATSKTAVSPSDAKATDKKSRKEKTQRVNNRTILYIKEVPAEIAEDDLKTKFAEFGVVKTVHIVQRVQGTAPYGLIIFDRPEDATKAAAARLFGGLFARQRKVQVYDLPLATTEEDIRFWFRESGEVKTVEITKLESAAESQEAPEETTSGQIEFALADGAAQALVRALNVRLPFTQKKIRAEYALLKKADDKEGEKGTDGTGADQPESPKEDEPKDDEKDEDEDEEAGDDEDDALDASQEKLQEPLTQDQLDHALVIDTDDSDDDDDIPTEFVALEDVEAEAISLESLKIETEQETVQEIVIEQEQTQASADRAAAEESAAAPSA
ncbi:uncharacterized protein BJ171DRAFT_237313 [Polychytrium aggregatum]|uniref:uncharacterized protein n=1 Tax=Polychytrium aggregatum TaxID=110093 RepID=UPI0022FDE3D1|nr:uncharacterized protein BJ171DRAFT_237313 [Polychytrium aggregatum]KAI9208260.1 hypothetical protein BJ171DRAFT_237313 [Polychytrium aggregatum]